MSRTLRIESARAWMCLLLVPTIVVITGCADDAASSSNVAGADRGDGSRPPVVSGTATGTASGDAGYDQLELPALPTKEEVASGPQPRTRGEIFEARREVPRLYLTGKTLKRVVAPTSRGIFVDDQTSEICWPALGCYNPDCPDRGEDGEPYAYIAANALAYVANDGSIAYRKPKQLQPDISEFSSNSTGEMYARDPSLLGHVCPACIEARDLASETDADRRRYQRWIRPHELPETTQALRELNEERRRRIVWERANR